MTTEIAFKFLASGRRPCNGGSGAWPKPSAWTPRARRVVPCESGYHGCRARQLIDWLGPELWRAEFEDVTDCGDKIVAARARLIERVEAWDDRTARLFACDCADRVVRLTGPDERAVAAIAMARRFAIGEATEAELAAAAAGAWDAARAAGAAWAAGAAERSWQSGRLLETLGLAEAA